MRGNSLLYYRRKLQYLSQPVHRIGDLVLFFGDPFREHMLRFFSLYHRHKPQHHHRQMRVRTLLCVRVHTVGEYLLQGSDLCRGKPQHHLRQMRGVPVIQLRVGVHAKRYGLPGKSLLRIRV